MVLWKHVICVEDTFGREEDALWGSNMWGKSHVGLREFWKKGGSDTRGHDGIAPLDKCHYNF